jgi:hypothetical protein
MEFHQTLHQPPDFCRRTRGSNTVIMTWQGCATQLDVDEASPHRSSVVGDGQSAQSEFEEEEEFSSIY